MQVSRQVFLWILYVGAFMAALLVLWAGYVYGPRFTYDSINYIYAGHALIEKGEFLRPFGQPYIEWPPLYPILLAILDIFPGNLLHKILFTQAIIMGITVGLSLRLAHRWIKRSVVLVACCIAIVFSTPLLVVNHFVWSESFFCLLAVIQLSLLIQYIHQPQTLSMIDLMLAGMLLCLQRHVGVFFIVGTSLIMWLYPVDVPLRKRLLRGVLYGAASVIPLLLWWARNHLVKGQIMNDYSETLFTVSLTDHFLAFHQVLTAWFLPGKLPVILRIGMLYMVAVSLIVCYLHIRDRSIHTQNTTFTIQASASTFIRPLSIFFFSYVLLTYAASFTVNEFIDDRILAPAYVPGILLFFGLLDRYLQTTQLIWLKKSVIYLCLLWTLYPVSRTLINVYNWRSHPVDIPVSQPVEERLRYLYQF